MAERSLTILAARVSGMATEVVYHLNDWGNEWQVGAMLAAEGTTLLASLGNVYEGDRPRSGDFIKNYFKGLSVATAVNVFRALAVEDIGFDDLNVYLIAITLLGIWEIASSCVKIRNAIRRENRYWAGQKSISIQEEIQQEVAQEAAAAEEDRVNRVAINDFRGSMFGKAIVLSNGGKGRRGPVVYQYDSGGREKKSWVQELERRYDSSGGQHASSYLGLERSEIEYGKGHRMGDYEPEVKSFADYILAAFAGKRQIRFSTGLTDNGRVRVIKLMDPETGEKMIRLLPPNMPKKMLVSLVDNLSDLFSIRNKFFFAKKTDSFAAAESLMDQVEHEFDVDPDWM